MLSNDVGKRLRMLLDADGDQVIAIRSGKISRSHYAKKLGVTPSALNRHVDVFATYEERLGISTGPVSRIKEMRVWLNDAFGAARLKVRDGKLDLTCSPKLYQS